MEQFISILNNPSYGYHKNVAFFFFLIFLSYVLTKLCKRYVHVMDRANARSLHYGAVPRSGGLAIVATVLVGIVTYRVIHRNPFVLFSPFWGLLSSSLVISAVSFYDDLTNRGLAFKVMSQLFGALTLMSFGIVIGKINVPMLGSISLGHFAYPITLIWIVGITNAFNFMDGINGLAAGVAVITSLTLAAFSLSHGSGFVFHVSYMVAAACMGYLMLNYPHGKIFMGDVGSTFLGFYLGAMAILAANYDSAHTSFMIVPIMLSMFIMETLFTFLWRIAHGQPVHKAHNMHPYQLLCRMGLSRKYVALIYVLIAAVILAPACIFYVYSNLGALKIAVLVLIVLLYGVYFSVVFGIASKKGLLPGACQKWSLGDTQVVEK